MKQSGIDWIGEIPDDWKIEKFGHVLKERNEKIIRSYLRNVYQSLLILV